MKNLLGVSLLLLSQFAFALDPGKPLQEASKAYLAEGAQAFITTLIKGSPIEGEKGVITQANTIKQIEAYYGEYQGLEVIYEKKLTKKVRLVYYVMNYEKSPVFGVTTYYKPNGEEVVTNFNFHTELWQIVPSEVVFK